LDLLKVRRVAHTGAAIHALCRITWIRFILTILARIACIKKGNIKSNNIDNLDKFTLGFH